MVECSQKQRRCRVWASFDILDVNCLVVSKYQLENGIADLPVLISLPNGNAPVKKRKRMAKGIRVKPNDRAKYASDGVAAN